MKIKISPIQTQKTVLAPSMQHSIEVLLLPVTSLNTTIETELQNNPLLEVDEEKTLSEKNPLEELLLRRLTGDFSYGNFTSSKSTDDEIVEEKPITRSLPLEDFLLQQLHLEVTDPLQTKIGEYIIGNIDQGGYVQLSTLDIAKALNIQEIALIEEVFQKIHHFEPLGIAARNLKECLIIQTRNGSHPSKKLIEHIIENYLEILGRKKFQDIARQLKISVEQVKSIAKYIATLEPKPARNYRPIESNIYITPDVVITKDKSGFNVQITKENIPHLRVNRFYESMLKDPKLAADTKEFIMDKIKSAWMFLKSIEQRNQTLKEIAEYILEHQKAFFEEGHLALKPMILKDVADSIGRNGSTVCRAISNKFIDTPQGLFPMKFFFSQSVSERTSESVATRGIKEEIKSRIEEENKDKPLSDQDLQLYFAAKGMHLARRTISKYRQAMNILPSHLRKN